MNKFKNLLERVGTKAKFTVGTLAAAGTTALATVAASAEAPTNTSALSTYSSQITGQFAQTANDLIPMLATVLGTGLGIFGIFFGIKLVKRIFTIVSKG